MDAERKSSGRAAALLLAAVFALSGCDSPQRTLDGLRQGVADYAEAPSDASAAKIEEGFARLDRQIEDLQAKGGGAEARALRDERDLLKARFAGARLGAGLQGLKQAARQVGEAFRQAGETIGVAPRSSPVRPGDDE
mgnify:CR=1 FL=1